MLMPKLWLGIAIAVPLFASGGGATFDAKVNRFTDNNGVWSKAAEWSLNLPLDENKEWTVGWDQEVDAVTGASRFLGSKDPMAEAANASILDAIPREDGRSGASVASNVPVDGTTGATVNGGRKVELRASESFKAGFSREGRGGGLVFAMSHESDYVSYAPGAYLSWDFNERNTTLGFSYSHNFDDFIGNPPLAPGGKKNIDSYQLTLAQSWTATTLTSMGAHWMASQGYLGHPYTPVYTQTGTMLTEVVPDRKNALALSAAMVQGITWNDILKASLQLDGRYYDDSWGLNSATVDFKVLYYLYEGAYVRLRTRYYDQSGANFARPVYGGGERYRTADIRFYPFHSWTFGGKVSIPFRESWVEWSRLVPNSVNFSYDYCTRNTYGDLERYQFYAPDETYHQGLWVLGIRYAF
jgi:hypothetical protein